MNYWLLISLFWLLSLRDDGWKVKKQKGFVEVIPQEKLYLDPGGKKNIPISFRIEDGYHIQAAKVLDDNLIPTKITLSPPSNIIVKDPIFPKPKSFQLKNSSSEMLVFSGKLDILLPVETSSTIKRGDYHIQGTLYYQPAACRQNRRLRPVRAAVRPYR